jgi:hypothetical protein
VSSQSYSIGLAQERYARTACQLDFRRMILAKEVAQRYMRVSITESYDPHRGPISARLSYPLPREAYERARRDDFPRFWQSAKVMNAQPTDRFDCIAYRS